VGVLGTEDPRAVVLAGCDAAGILGMLDAAGGFPVEDSTEGDAI
jgi:hypothetical protein